MRLFITWLYNFTGIDEKDIFKNITLKLQKVVVAVCCSMLFCLYDVL